MKRNLKVFGVLAGLSLFSLCTMGQTYWVLSYQGTATSGATNGHKLVTTPVTEKTFIQQCASNSGVSTENLVLVLHASANDTGDTLEVINRNDPNLFRCEIFKFAYNFSGSPSQSYTNATGTILKRWAYIFSSEGGHSRGSVIVTGNAANSRAGTNAPVHVDGKVQYWLGTWMESTADPNAVVCSGTFKSTEALSFQ